MITLSDIETFAAKKGFSKDINIFRLISYYIESLEIPSDSSTTLSSTSHCLIQQTPVPSKQFTEPQSGEYSVEDLLKLFSI